MSVGRRILAAIRRFTGFEPVLPAPPPHDDLEPYCTEKVLQHRLERAATVPTGTHKAIHKIAARYGAEL